MSSISFNFTDLEDIPPALWSLRCGIGKRDCTITEKHLAPLDDLAVRLGVTQHARQNAKRLATGYRDLVVLLLEPSDKAEEVSYHEMLECSTALKYVNDSLRLAFDGRRDLDNTVVLDIRPYRSDRIRMQQKEEDRIADDEPAYEATEEILTLLRPDLVLICQCQTSDVGNRFAADYCSSVESSGDLSLSGLRNGHKIVKINSFHPMYFARTDKDKEPLKRMIRKYLFDTTFLVAANFLAGRRLSGFGMDNLRQCAEHGPVTKFTSEGVRITCQWTDEDDVASPSLIQRLEELGLGAKHHRSTELDQLLSRNLQKHKKYDDFVS
ncbi:hypothetical protein AYL99_11177 [Fonsecaea erecta]|uniref:Uncharacterized protein n=1 Tax=Fonsecaea erecta TaxID=1367422 RepID=A0A178Z4Q2_9EURO|nr:hypothetical protein AYL99_11177 [Fonsecaea erecta]OAP54729.1 hypothetical protein AYL99_11177 [Fonsecaea erecta]